MLDQIGNAKYITTLDLAKGYWQVPMSDEDCEKTAVRSPMVLYKFIVMPFSLSGVLTTFQQMIDQNLHGLSEFVEVYLDDVVIYSSNWMKHLQHITNISSKSMLSLQSLLPT